MRPSAVFARLAAKTSPSCICWRLRRGGCPGANPIQMSIIGITRFTVVIVMGCISLFLNTLSPEQAANPKSVYQIAISGDGRVLAATYDAYPYRSIIDFFDSTNGQLL